MEIIFLGTSSGTPTQQRNVSGVAVNKQNSKNWYLVDCGEGTQHQILKTNLSLQSLQAICITHVHGDHCYGLPGLLASAAMAGRKDKLIIIAPKEIEQFLTVTQSATQLYLPFDIEFIDVTELDSEFILKDFAVETINLSHRVPTVAFNFIEQNIESNLDKDKLLENGIKPGPAWGQLQQGNDVILPDGKKLLCSDYLQITRAPRSIVICGDNDSPELLSEIKPKPDVIVHESTYTENIWLQVGAEPQHSYAKNVAECAERIQLKNLILTHFSARYGYDTKKSSSIDDIENEAKKYFFGNLFLANDFDVYTLDKQAQLSKK